MQLLRITLLLSAFLSLVGSTARAQTPNPYTAVVGPQFGYTAYGSRAVFESIIGQSGTVAHPPGVIFPANDDGVVSLNMPFDFKYFGHTYTEGRPFYMSVNGYVTFDHLTTANLPTSLINDPVSFGNQPAMAVLFQDLTLLNGAGLYSRVTGSAGDRTFTMEWHGVQDVNVTQNTNPVTFQAVLFEGSNRIRFNYADTIFGNNSNNGGASTVGIRDLAYNYPYENVLQWGFRGGPENGGEGIPLGDHDFRIDFELTFSSVPEPGTIALMGLAGLGVASTYWWSRKKKAKR